MKKIGIGTVLLVLLSGVFYYAYIIRLTCNVYKNDDFKVTLLHTQQKKEFSLFFCSNLKSDYDEKLFLFSVTPAQDCFRIIGQWLLRAWQKRIVSAPITCQSVILDHAMTTVFVSFDFPLFNDTIPVHIKIQIINSLLKTIQQVHPSFQSVYLLVRHEPMIDRHIDWIKPFSILGYPLTSF